MSIIINARHISGHYIASVTSSSNHVYGKVVCVRIRGKTVRDAFIRIQKKVWKVSKRLHPCKDTIVIITGIVPHHVLYPLSDFLNLRWRNVESMLNIWVANSFHSGNAIVGRMSGEIKNISLQLKRVDEIHADIVDMVMNAEFHQEGEGQLMQRVIAKYQEISGILHRIQSTTEQIEHEQERIINQSTGQQPSAEGVSHSLQAEYEIIVLKSRISELLSIQPEKESLLRSELKHVLEEKDALEKELVEVKKEIPSQLKLDLKESKASLATIWNILDSIRTVRCANHHDVECVAQASTLTVYPTDI